MEKDCHNAGQLNFYPILGAVSVTLEPDDDSSRALAEMTETHSIGFTHLIGIIAPGSYKLFVRGALNLYELVVNLKEASLPADEFEPNENFDTATRFTLLEHGDNTVFSIHPVHSAGIYDLTLHNVRCIKL